MKKLLIIQTAFIGDVILATALIEKLKFFHPNTEIDFLLRKGNETLLRSHPKLNQVLIWNKKSHKTWNLLKLIFKIRGKKYDIVINLQRYSSTGLMTWLSGATQKIGFVANPLSSRYTKKISVSIGDGKHETERNQLLISDLTDSKSEMPKLYPSKADYAKIKKYTGTDYVCLAPASVWATKQLPDIKWVELTRNIPPQTKIYLLGGKRDHLLCESIIDGSSHKQLTNLAGELTLLESAALMETAKMNFVNDSAPLHLCSAMNAPTTAFFCSTTPKLGFGPLSANSKVVETPNEMSCRPCGIHGKKTCPLGHFNCAHSIKINNSIGNKSYERI